ncbi:MAG: pyridoxine 5'-phosphate synthase [Candidatus Riflebacteria bacterium]|nr:pyridoxine 5'-phosphate synthase [Candidatus Riflebacteria bacterium]
MIKLGVNIDHVATIREARKGCEPDPVHAAALAELSGADGITVHLREDRRHIQDRDLKILRSTVKTRLNLEMAVEEEVVKIAEEIRPEMATLVPEKRQEVTTEGGLDVVSGKERIKEVIKRLKKQNILVSLFIDPDKKQVEKSAELKADFIEFHTGCFANTVGKEHEKETERLHLMAELAVKLGLRVNAGHGLNYWNVSEVVSMAGIEEFNIGHSIISRAVLVGLERAVREMKDAIRNAELLRKI